MERRSIGWANGEQAAAAIAENPHCCLLSTGAGCATEEEIVDAMEPGIVSSSRVAAVNTDKKI